jgi:beta-lactamase superfamily II metal-dependent hydrolase
VAIKYVGEFETKLRRRGAPPYTLIWGDPCHVRGNGDGDHVEVRARGMIGTVPASSLMDRSLLEIYVIDVGQGDGILMRTPDDKWHLIDAGVANEAQMLHKGAPNFIGWKFRRDLDVDKVPLENVIVSHPDFDHFGGVTDVLAGDFGRWSGEDGPLRVEVENLYHCGIGRFRDAPQVGATAKGEVPPFPRGEHGVRRRGTFVTELLDGKTSFANPPRPFGRAFGAFARQVASKPRRVRRLSSADRFLPGYEPGDGEVVIRVLGPVLENFGAGRSGLRVLGTESVTINGHSVVLRLDYRQARIILTGDLNDRSQRLLLSYQPEEAFAADVAKACHHGSEEVDLTFTKALQARATVISSGDNEDYSHPRPVVMGASARYGREARDDKGDVMPPLVYSTELARSIRLAQADKLRVPGDGSASETVEAETAEVKPEPKDAEFRSFEYTPVSTDLVYGLVNVRTDGRHILCATLEESGSDFDIKVFEAGVTP